MKKFTARRWLMLALIAAAGTAQAEGNISIAQQFGIGYLLLDVVRDQQLIEKEGKKKGWILRWSGARSRAPPP